MKKLTVFGALLLFFNSSASAEVLQVYTYDSLAAEWGIGPQLKAGFEAQCGCEVKFTALEDAVSILSRLRIEGASTPADVVVGLDNHLTERARALKLFAPHRQNLADLSNLPTAWSDDIFLPFDFGWFDFVYNSEKLASPPKSLDALIRSTGDSPSLIIQDPRTSSPGLGLVVWLKALYGDKASEAWQKLAPKIKITTKGWSEAYALFLKGEADMVLSYTTSPAYHRLAEGDSRFRAMLPTEGNVLQTETAAVLSSSKQPELARSFLRYLVSEELQRRIPETQWMFPARKIELPEGFSGQNVPQKSLTIDAARIEAESKTWINEWRQALVQSR